MAAYKSRAFVRSKYDTPFKKTPLKWIPRSKSGALKSRSLWAAHTRLGNVWEYPPPPPGCRRQFQISGRISNKQPAGCLSNQRVQYDQFSSTIYLECEFRIFAKKRSITTAFAIFPALFICCAILS